MSSSDGNRGYGYGYGKGKGGILSMSPGDGGSPGGGWLVRISGHRVNDRGNVFYHVRTQCTGAREHSVWRRFSDFVALQQSMKEDKSVHAVGVASRLPALPSKFFKTSPTTREVSLTNYMQDLMAAFSAKGCQTLPAPLLNFLDVKVSSSMSSYTTAASAAAAAAPADKNASGSSARVRMRQRSSSDRGNGRGAKQSDGSGTAQRATSSGAPLMSPASSSRMMSSSRVAGASSKRSSRPSMTRDIGLILFVILAGLATAYIAQMMADAATSAAPPPSSSSSSSSSSAAAESLAAAGSSA